MGLSIKEAFEVAKEELSLLIDLDTSDYRLEQIEFNKEEGYWDVVISYLTPNKNKPAILLQALPFERIYKRIKVSDNKEVTGVYMFHDS